jgi:hypothetical protein
MKFRAHVAKQVTTSPVNESGTKCKLTDDKNPTTPQNEPIQGGHSVNGLDRNKINSEKIGVG